MGARKNPRSKSPSHILKNATKCYKNATKAGVELLENTVATHMASFLSVPLHANGSFLKEAVAHFGVGTSTVSDVYHMTTMVETFLNMSGLIVLVICVDGASINHKFQEAYCTHFQQFSSANETKIKCCAESRSYPEILVHVFYDFPHVVKTVRNNISKSMLETSGYMYMDEEEEGGVQIKVAKSRQILRDQHVPKRDQVQCTQKTRS